MSHEGGRKGRQRVGHHGVTGISVDLTLRDREKMSERMKTTLALVPVFKNIYSHPVG